MVDSTLVYRSFYEAAQALPPQDRLAFYDAIMQYSFDDAEPDVEGIAKALFIMAKPNIDSRNAAVSAGKKGGRPKKETALSEDEKPGDMQEQKPGVYEKEKGGLRKGFQNSKTNTEAEADTEADTDIKKRVRFSPPTVEEVRAYCRERGNSVDAQQFVDFYASKGWKVGNSPMKDWKACVRTWEQRDKAKPVKKNNFTRFDQRSYSNDDLEQMLGVGVV